jgi:hypothetical protein
MWSGGISGRNRVRPTGEWAQGLTCQTEKYPACHIQFVSGRFYLFIHRQAVNSIKVSFSERKFQVTRSQFNFFCLQSKQLVGLQVTTAKITLPERELCQP